MHAFATRTDASVANSLAFDAAREYVSPRA
jgi:hypothetical protein